MIKLGKAYFDESHIVAIMPTTVPLPEGGCVERFVVHVEGGHIFYWDAEAEEVQQTLEAVGLIEPDAQAEPPVFTRNEQAELYSVLERGFLYAAKDSDRRVWAYGQAPTKGDYSWQNDDSHSDVVRLTAGKYAALSFDDVYPLDIAVALGADVC